MVSAQDAQHAACRCAVADGNPMQPQTPHAQWQVRSLRAGWRYRKRGIRPREQSAQALQHRFIVRSCEGGRIRRRDWAQEMRPTRGGTEEQQQPRALQGLARPAAGRTRPQVWRVPPSVAAMNSRVPTGLPKTTGPSFAASKLQSPRQHEIPGPGFAEVDLRVGVPRQTRLGDAQHIQGSFRVRREAHVIQKREGLEPCHQVLQ